MASLRSRRISGAVADWETHLGRIIDVHGGDAFGWDHAKDLTAFAAATGTQPTGWTVTLVEGGAGESDWLASDDAGILSRVTCDANENDGVSAQLNGSSFEFTSGQGLVYCGMQFDINDVDQTDLFFGFAVTDTALLGGVADAVYLESVDGSATLSAVTEVGSAETQTDSIGTLVDATTHFIEIVYYGGASVYFLFDGALVATHTAGITAVPLRFSLEFLTGEAIANTLDIRQMRAFQIGL